METTSLCGNAATLPVVRAHRSSGSSTVKIPRDRPSRETLQTPSGDEGRARRRNGVEEQRKTPPPHSDATTKRSGDGGWTWDALR